MTLKEFGFVMLTAGMGTSHVDATVDTSFNKTEWLSWVDDISTIPFTGHAPGTPITDQYAAEGVVFQGPPYAANGAGFSDGFGVVSAIGVHVFFAEPQSWLAIDHGGTARFQLFRQGVLVGVSATTPFGGIGSFVGIRTNAAFDRAFITSQPTQSGAVFVDDLHWGAPVEPVDLPPSVDVAEYISSNAWLAAVNHQFDAITFADFPANTTISEHYAQLGITFFGVNLTANDPTTFPNDGSGVFGLPYLSMRFSQPKHWVSIDHAGPARYTLFNQGQAIHQTQISLFQTIGNFTAVISALPFDEVRVRCPTMLGEHVFIDDLRWGPRNCPGDISGFKSGKSDSTVTIDDLLAVINAWGSCVDPNNCPADIAPPGAGQVPAGNDAVDVDDLLAVINAWGACPG